MGTPAMVYLGKDGEIERRFWVQLDGYPSNMVDALEEKTDVEGKFYRNVKENFQEDDSWFDMDKEENRDSDPFVCWYYLIREDGEIFVSKDRSSWTPAYMTGKTAEDILEEIDK